MKTKYYRETPTYDDAKRRVLGSPTLRQHESIILDDGFDAADHWLWVTRATVKEILAWAIVVEDVGRGKTVWKA